MAADLRLKIDVFKQINAEVAECKRCGLWRSRKNPVLGDGDINAKIVFIGEAPGYMEDVKGKPFVGAAGKLLNESLIKAGISRDKVYITNVVKCRPPENRDPRSDEIEACRSYLDRQLDLIRPKIIVTLGRHSTAYVFSKIGREFKSISEVQGKIFEAELWGEKIYIIPSYHPAVALYNAKLKVSVEKTIKLVSSIKID
jgi:DNA polymerase